MRPHVDLTKDKSRKEWALSHERNGGKGNEDTPRNYKGIN